MKFGQYISTNTPGDYYNTISSNDIIIGEYISSEWNTDVKNISVTLRTGNFNSTNKYYLQFSINPPQNSESNTYELQLVNNNDPNNVIIKKLPNYALSDFYSFNVNNTYQQLINPRANYPILVFLKKNRRQSDIEKLNGLSITKFLSIKNLCNGNTFPTTIKKLSVQGRPGLQMCINGEDIKVGKSGIYELNNGVDITYLGFVPTIEANSNTLETFVVNYEY